MILHIEQQTFSVSLTIEEAFDNTSAKSVISTAEHFDIKIHSRDALVRSRF